MKKNILLAFIAALLSVMVFQRFSSQNIKNGIYEKTDSYYKKASYRGSRHKMICYYKKDSSIIIVKFFTNNASPVFIEIKDNAIVDCSFDYQIDFENSKL